MQERIDSELLNRFREEEWRKKLESLGLVIPDSPEDGSVKDHVTLNQFFQNVYKAFKDKNEVDLSNAI